MLRPQLRSPRPRDFCFSQKLVPGSGQRPQPRCPTGEFAPALASPSLPRTAKAQPGYAQALQGDPRAHLQLAEREQALLVARETVQVRAARVPRPWQCPQP